MSNAVLRSSFIILLVTLFLSGCASVSIPSKDQADALLVIPVHADNSTFETWVRKYKFDITQSGKTLRTVLVPTSSDRFVIIDDLPSGQYEIKQYTSYIASTKWRPTGDASRATDFEISPINLELKPGGITILDYVFSSIQSTKGGFVYSEAAFTPLVQEERNALENALRTKNKYGWTIAEPTHELPTKAEFHSHSSNDNSRLEDYVKTLTVEDSDWSEWMNEGKLHENVRQMNDQYYYPIAIEGQYVDGAHQFRAVFKPNLEGDFEWAANWQTPKKDYLSLNVKRLGKGFERIWLQTYNGMDRRSLITRDNYQAVWIRLGSE